MMTCLSRSVGFRTFRYAITATAAVALLVAAAAGCASNAASSTVSDSDFGRLAANQTQSVDDARKQLALARDELGRAKLSVVNDQYESESARTDQAAASVDRNRADVQSKIGEASNEPGQMQQARDDTTAAQLGTDVANARLAYTKKLATSQAAQVTAAERKVDFMTEKVNLAKLQALEAAAVPAAGKYDRAKAMERVVDAQRAYDRAMVTAATALRETTAAKKYWQELAQKQE